MPRPSQNTDQRLIKTAREMLGTSGLSGLNLRQVAKKAGVNLGMFHYHFKTKEVFSRRVLQDTYEKFFKEFSLETSVEGDPLERLRAALSALARFIRDNRAMVLGILHDVLNRDKVALDFVQANGPRHGLVIVGLVGQCQKQGKLRKMPLPAVLPTLMGACLFPLVVVAVLERLGSKGLRRVPLAMVRSHVASDKAIRDRVDLMLSSLAPVKGGSR